MSWAETTNLIFGFIFIFCIIMFVIGVVQELSISDWRRRAMEWQESRIRDLEWENHDLKSELEWVEGNQNYYQRQAKLADERNDRLALELDAIYRLLAKRNIGEGGCPSQMAAA